MFDTICSCRLSRVSRSGRRVCPGQAYGLYLFGGGIDLRVCTIFGGDEDPSELDEHVLVAGVGLGGIPASPASVLGHDGGVVAGQVVPDDDQALGEQPERDGALDGQAGAVAGFADAGEPVSRLLGSRCAGSTSDNAS
ncbi:MAG: hypothetical protein QOG57_3818 [Pseudonocardiales bacterium]|nr:hypothetical protein [Pseudonocardiales bacterium]